MLQCKIMQHNTLVVHIVPTILAANTILVKLLKWHIQILLVKIVVGIFITQTQKIDNYKL